MTDTLNSPPPLEAGGASLIRAARCPALATCAPKGSGTIVWSRTVRKRIAELLACGTEPIDATDFAVEALARKSVKAGDYGNAAAFARHAGMR